MTRDQLGTVLLASGALVGAALATASLVRGAERPDELDEDVVATVDGRPILRSHYERALAAVAADRRDGALTPEDRRRVLDRLVDEELLVGRALELGLASRDRRVRNDLSRSMIDLLEARAEGEPPPDEATLRAFYEAEADRFRHKPRFRISHAFFAVTGEEDQEARRRAERAIGSGDLSTGDPFGLPVPEGEVPLSAVARLLGPTAARGVAELEPGATGGPWRGAGGFHVVRVLGRRDGEMPPYDEVRELVRGEHARDRAERRMRDFLDARRGEVEIVVREEP